MGACGRRSAARAGTKQRGSRAQMTVGRRRRKRVRKVRLCSRTTWARALQVNTRRETWYAYMPVSMHMCACVPSRVRVQRARARKVRSDAERCAVCSETFAWGSLNPAAHFTPTHARTRTPSLHARTHAARGHGGGHTRAVGWRRTCGGGGANGRARGARTPEVLRRAFTRNEGSSTHVRPRVRGAGTGRSGSGSNSGDSSSSSSSSDGLTTWWRTAGRGAVQRACGVRVCVANKDLCAARATARAHRGGRAKATPAERAGSRCSIAAR